MSHVDTELLKIAVSKTSRMGAERTLCRVPCSQKPVRAGFPPATTVLTSTLPISSKTSPTQVHESHIATNDTPLFPSDRQVFAPLPPTSPQLAVFAEAAQRTPKHRQERYPTYIAEETMKASKLESVGFFFGVVELIVSLAICITASIMLHYAPSLDPDDVEQYGSALTAVSWAMWVLDAISKSIV